MAKILTMYCPLCKQAWEMRVGSAIAAQLPDVSSGEVNCHTCDRRTLEARLRDPEQQCSGLYVIVVYDKQDVWYYHGTNEAGQDLMVDALEGAKRLLYVDAGLKSTELKEAGLTTRMKTVVDGSIVDPW